MAGGPALAAAAAAAVVCAAAAGGLILLRRRVPPRERERRRRAELLREGRTGDGLLTDVREDGILEYSYDVRGISYHASQDLSALRDRLPPEPWTLIGPATIKYMPRNPANSMVMSEEWSGLRTRAPRGETDKGEKGT